MPITLYTKIIRCKWVFTIKNLLNDLLEKLKARLVAMGNHQVEGNFYDTFSPIVKHPIRWVFPLTMAKDWELRKLDVTNAFLNGKLSQVVYTKQPPSFE